jgi:hypothetical protein
MEEDSESEPQGCGTKSAGCLRQADCGFVYLFEGGYRLADRDGGLHRGY